MIKPFKYPLISLITAGLIFCLAACSNRSISSGADTSSAPSETAANSMPLEIGSKEIEISESGRRPEQGTASAETVTQGTRSTVLVVYFSATGNTEDVAEKIAEVTNGELYEIIPAQPYSPEDLDYRDKQSRTSLEMNAPDIRPEISSEAISLEKYSTLYLGYPIWHGQAPRILSTFVESYSFDDITVIPFCTAFPYDLPPHPASYGKYSSFLYPTYFLSANKGPLRVMK